MKMGFIGAGKVGIALGRYFKYNGFEISAYFSRTYFDISEFGFDNSIFVNSIENIVSSSDIIFITTTDLAIADIWSQLKKLSIQNKIICHCSGNLSSDVFFDIDKLNAFACSLHPMMAINSKDISLNKISKAFFTVEGNDTAVRQMKNIITICGNKLSVVRADNKVKYHAAACFVSNFSVALNKVAVDILKECGFSQEQACSAINPLMSENIDNICNYGFVNSLTGPVERNDYNTIEKHLNCLNENQRNIYKLLSRELIEIANVKHQGQNYSTLKNLLEDKK